MHIIFFVNMLHMLQADATKLAILFFRKKIFILKLRFLFVSIPRNFPRDHISYMWQGHDANDAVGG